MSYTCMDSLTPTVLPISVIIATKNVEATLTESLESIKRNNPAEIIIVDGNSTDKTLKIAQKYTKKIFSDNGGGPSFAHQIGAEQATQKYVAYVDADIILAPDSLATLLKELQLSKLASMEAIIRPVKEITYWERAVAWNSQESPLGGGLAAAVIARSTILNYKFDPDLDVGEDYDFKLRVEKQGLKVGNSRRAVAYHYHRVNFRGFIRQRVNYGKGKSRLLKKNGPWNPRLWPPIITVYWVFVCLTKKKPIYIPYFISDGVLETAGLLKGILDSKGRR
jgi:glycosyltransferase involved in cell wall biosynthesis